MPVALIIQLVTALGPSAINLVTQLFATWDNSNTVTADQWKALIASTETSSKDAMAGALTSAGIDPASDAGKALLTLAS